MPSLNTMAITAAVRGVTTAEKATIAAKSSATLEGVVVVVISQPVSLKAALQYL